MKFQDIINFFPYPVIHILTNMPFIRKLMKIMNRYLSPKNDILVNVKKHKMYANTIDRLLALYLWKFFALGSFETNLIKKATKKNMVVFDIGANIGYYSLIFAEMVGKKGKVYAFEPDPSNYRLLAKNIKANNYRNVIAVQKAVSNENRMINFYHSEEHRGDHRAYNPGGKRKIIKVPAITIDRFAGKKLTPGIIKIDVQGAEFSVIQGMSKVIKRNNNLIIFCEFCPGYMKKAGYSPKRFLDLLTKHGFKFALINEKNWTVKLIDVNSLMQMSRTNGYYNIILTKH